ncbi:MAG: SDR family NAD(P)-dependent oxidoreductase [bacterium]|nr:SDR family NAD(P)-dependent oxidoreductase [bacterium]MXV90764.1 SDR family oxidoreductase [Acidimicrobiia bacterium]MYC44906.1 SDR family oxidoreductase [Acidimicrobiia bacterium]MYI18623.1 SDR family oxidoreductase [Acidimicrobiia bacterium]
MTSMRRFEGKVAVVSGAEGGIGGATVARLAAEGATVWSAVLPGLEGPAGHPAVEVDVTVEEHWIAAFEKVVETSGRLDVLVNSAGILGSGTAEDTSLDQWHRVLDVNLTGVFLGCRAAVGHMRRSGGGAIVNLSSFAGLRGLVGMVSYATSKGGVITLTQSLAKDHAAEGIRVNAVCPGSVDTPMIAAVVAAADDPEERLKRTVEGYLIERLGRPAEIAATIAYLASDDASFITGQALPVDGGRTIH